MATVRDDRDWRFDESDVGGVASITVTAETMADLELDLAPRSITVCDKCASETRTLVLPFEVVPESCTAKFKSKRRELVVVLVRPTTDPPGELSKSQAISCDLHGGGKPDESSATVAERVGDSTMSELHEREPDGSEPDVPEAEGETAFAELRALLAEGPTNLAAGVRQRLQDGRINAVFCQVLRQNLRFAMEKGQQNKLVVFRRIQEEIRKLLTESQRTSMGRHEHSPTVDATVDTPLEPRHLEFAEVLDATPIRAMLQAGSKKSHAADKRRRIAQLAEQVGERLSLSGWVVLDGLLDATEAEAVRTEMQQLEPHFHASEIWVGHQAAVGAQMTMTDIRGDKILWMCGHHPQRSVTPWSHATASAAAADFEMGEDPTALQPCSGKVRQEAREGAMKTGGARRVQPSERWLYRNLAMMLDGMDELVWSLRKSKSAGRCSGLADRSDAMLAVYPATGARFQRHVDNTAGDGRRLTVLCYLNRDWKLEDGGELCVYPKGCKPVAIAPKAGRLALFHADQMLHEVRPSHRHRYSVNVWYYDTEERDKAQAQLAAKGRIASDGSAVTDADNLAARSLLQSVLDGDGSATDAGELERLAAQAEALPPGAAFTVAQVTMGSAARQDVTPADVAHGLRSMTPAALTALRKGLSVMGKQ